MPSARPKLFLGTMVVSVVAFAVVGVAADVTDWDDHVVEEIESHYDESRNDVLNVLMDVIMGLGVIGALAVGIGLLARRRRMETLFWGAIVIGVVVLDLLLKALFQRPSIGVRQDEYSFPSGNAMASVAVVAGLALLTRSTTVRRWLLIAGIPAVVIYGTLLVFLLWHYPSDVIAGWFAGLAWVAGLAFVLDRLGTPGTNAHTAHDAVETSADPRLRD